MGVWEAQHNIDQYLVLGFLCGTAPTTHLSYLGNFTRFPIKAPTTPEGVDRLLADLREDITKPPRQERLCQAWISPETWGLINARIVSRRTRSQKNSREFSRTIKESLQADLHQRAAKAGSVVESLLASDPHIIQEAWIWMQGWYKDAIDHPSLPSRVAITTMMA